MSHLATFTGTGTGVTVNTGSIAIPATATYCTFMVLMRGADGADSTLSSATLGAQAVTLNSGTLRQFNGFQAIEAGYVLAADLPSGSVTATATRASGGDGMILAVSFFDDAAQVAPLVNLNGYDSAPPDPVTTSITTTGNAVLLDMIGTSEDAAVFTEQETGQTETAAEGNFGGSTAVGVSARAVTGAASHAMSWDTAANSARTTHVVLAIETAGAPSGLPEVTDVDTDEIIYKGQGTFTATVTGVPESVHSWGFRFDASGEEATAVSRSGDEYTLGITAAIQALPDSESLAGTFWFRPQDYVAP